MRSSVFSFGRAFFRGFRSTSSRWALAAVPFVLVSRHLSQQLNALEQQPQSGAAAASNKATATAVNADGTGVYALCPASQFEEGDLKLFELNNQKILVAKIGGSFHACDAVSPVDGKTLFDSTLLIGDKIYDTVNGAIFSIKEGVAEYSPCLRSLKKHMIGVNEAGVLSVKIDNSKAGFDTVNMRGWVPDFTNLLILGSGTEGLYLARALRQAKYRGLITMMFSEDIAQPYDKIALLEDLSNLENSGVREKEFIEEFQVKIAKNKESAKYINIDKRTVKTVPGHEDPVEFQKLVYALGSRPRFHGIIGLGLQGIYSPSTFAEFKQLKTDLPKMKRIVIVGDNLNSIRLANNLKKHGNANTHITLVTESEGLLHSQRLGDAVHATLAEELEKSGIEIINNSPITGAFGQSKVEKISLQGDKQLECDSLFLMRDEFPNVDSCELSMRICKDGALYTDPFQKTVSQNIWAIGSTASIVPPFLGERTRMTSQGDVMMQAHSTALNLIDKRLTLRTIPFDTLKLNGVKLNVIGFTGQNTHSIVQGDVESKDYIVYYFRGEQLIGASSPNRFRDLAIVREALYQDIIPRGQFEINTTELLSSIRSLKPSKLQSDVLKNMRKATHIVK